MLDGLPVRKIKENYMDSYISTSSHKKYKENKNYEIKKRLSDCKIVDKK